MAVDNVNVVDGIAIDKDEFCFGGNRQHIRTEKEMMHINREEADLAFKQYKKELIDSLLLGNGFCSHAIILRMQVYCY